MTEKQKKLYALQRAQSEKREKISTLDTKADRTDEETTALEKLDRELRELEPQFREALKSVEAEQSAAIIETSSTETPEGREAREIRAKVSMGSFLGQRLSGRDAWGGAEAEYAALHNVQANEIPIDYFRREERAVTPAPTLTSQTTQAVSTVRPTIEYAFTPRHAESLGVVLQPTGPGQAHFVVTTTAPPAEPKAKSASVPNTAAALTLATRRPTRFGGQIEIQVEDEAVFPSLTSDLDRPLASSLASVLDDQILVGSGSGANLDSLLNQASNVTAATAVETFSSGVARYAALIDGVHATDWADIRALIGIDTFALYSGLITTGTDTSLFDYLKMKLGSIIVSKRVPAKSGSAQKGIVTLQGRGEPITVPIWSGMSMRIEDDVTKAGQGVKIVTLSLLAASPFVPWGVDQVVETHAKIS